ncbi:MAG: hypothetical protein LBM98_01475 [Oscillospiraceae bacterium]|nr:hypothetical protein [Oscillospiraceae bacterium]
MQGTYSGATPQDATSSHVLRLTSHVLRLTSHVPRPTPSVSRPPSNVPRPTSTVPAPCAVFASAAALATRRTFRRAAIQCREHNIRTTYRRTCTSTLDCFAAYQ